MKTFIQSVLFIGILFFSQRSIAQKWATVVQTHHFSNTNELDTFKLFYNPVNLKDTITFEIISLKGNKIYQVKFPGWALFDYGKPSYMFYSEKGWKEKNYYKNRMDSIAKTDSLKRADEQYLQLKITGFFDDKHFYRNPIPDILKQTKDFLVVGSYETLMNEPDLIGFFYHLYEGDGRMIAYSSKKNKVVLFWNCC